MSDTPSTPSATPSPAPSRAHVGQKISKEEIANRFNYHAPHGDQATRYNKIRTKLGEMAQMIVDETPASREQTLAVGFLEQAMFHANAAIARHEKPGSMPRE